MLGLAFDTCNEFGLSFSFESCQLNHSTFYKRNLKKIRFAGSRLEEVDFTECNLSEAIFDSCDLHNAQFDRTNLEKADFRTAFNFIIDPENNRLKKARFSNSGLSGLLHKYDLRIEM